MTKAATAREQRAEQKFEQAARQADRGTRAGREAAARLITQGNAIKAGRPVGKGRRAPARSKSTPLRSEAYYATVETA